MTQNSNEMSGPKNLSRQIIPIVFAFDENLLLPAKVTLGSLLRHANATTNYDIYILCNKDTLPHAGRSGLREIVSAAKGSSITFIEIEDQFSNAFVVRGISIPTYYRLLLPSILSEHDVVLYCDVDIVVLDDLGNLYRTELHEALLAGVKGVYQNQEKDYLREIEVTPGEYVNAGILLMNLAEMRKANLVERFLKMAETNYLYQDQDILNIACKGRTRFLNPRYNIHAMFNYQKGKEYVESLFHEVGINDSFKNISIVHYAGKKPWNSFECFFYDLWWEEYRNLDCYDHEYYLHFQEAIQVSYRDLEFRLKEIRNDFWYLFGQGSFLRKVKGVIFKRLIKSH